MRVFGAALFFLGFPLALLYDVDASIARQTLEAEAQASLAAFKQIERRQTLIECRTSFGDTWVYQGVLCRRKLNRKK